MSTIVPLIQNFLPHDTLTFTKCGGNIRVDFKNIKLSKSPQGSAKDQNPFKQNFSLIVSDQESKEQASNSTLFLLDWDNKIYISLDRDAREIDSKPAQSLFGNKKSAKIDKYNCQELSYNNKFKMNKHLNQNQATPVSADHKILNEAELNQNESQSLDFDTPDLNTQLWISQDVPLPFSAFAKILEIAMNLMPDPISMNFLRVVQKQQEQLKICAGNPFPLQIRIPLFYSLNIQIKFSNIKMLSQAQNKQNLKLFEIPGSFKEENRIKLFQRFDQSGFRGNVFEKFQQKYQGIYKL
eukprot:403370250